MVPRQKRLALSGAPSITPAASAALPFAPRHQQGFVKAVEARLARTVKRGRRPLAVLDLAAAHLLVAPNAKRSRTWWVGLLSAPLGLELGAMVDLAAAAELIHAASVLHDDVVDAGTTRRGRPTVNVQWSNGLAVLAGDWLLTQAFHALDRYPPEVIRDAVLATAQMTRAAAVELQARHQPDLSMAGWRAIARGKTGALFQWCAAAVARAAGHSQLTPWRHGGMQLGVTFQMADDLRDLMDDGKGKDHLADIRNRNPNHALAFLSAKDPAARRALQAAWSNGAVGRAPAQRLALQLRSSPALPALFDAFSRTTDRTMEAVVPLLGPQDPAQSQQLAQALLGRLPWHAQGA